MRMADRVGLAYRVKEPAHSCECPNTACQSAPAAKAGGLNLVCHVPAQRGNKKSRYLMKEASGLLRLDYRAVKPVPLFLQGRAQCSIQYPRPASRQRAYFGSFYIVLWVMQ